MGDPDAVELADLTVTGLRRVNALVRDTHLAVQARNYRLLRPLGPLVAPVYACDRTVATGLYAAVDAGLRLSGAAASRLAGAAFGSVKQQRPWAATAVGIAHGFYGDHLSDTAADAMSVRHAGAPLPLSAASIVDAWPQATSKVAVFVHGLVETEQIWSPRKGGEGVEADPGFAARLRDELDYTPVLVRYNSGLPIRANGDALVDLLNDLVANWPTPLEELVLIGHSMGGLVSHTALARQPAWAELVSATVSLGTPFLGAPLARGTAALGQHAAKLAEARWLHTMLDQVSAGVRDLRSGPDAATFEPMREHGSHLFVAGVAVPERFAVVGKLVGDGLVVESSAVGGPAYAKVQSRTIWGVHHQQLFSDARAYAEIRDWLASSRA